ncbi:MAG TPA: catalase [Bacteriovoracaceae bacterium]|nr:catalase [Bacteriovoracaceae bacterium]
MTNSTVQRTINPQIFTIQRSLTVARNTKDKNDKKTSPSTAKNRPAAKILENKKIQDMQQNVVDPSGKDLTTDHGLKISDTDNSLKAGPRGPSLLEDFHLREKIMRFDHERIPERVVHARGAAAHGTFQAYQSQKKWTKAGFLQDPSQTTPVFVRFSTVAGSRGSADTARDVRGFAVKFYTEEGNFDLVGNNIPVFFIQDGIKFPDLIHAVKPEPHNEIPQAASAHDTFWDFASLTPETTHMLMWQLSDRAIPRSYSTMQGFGVHTFRLISEDGKMNFVKFHWIPVSGVHSLVWDEAVKIMGKDPDFHRRGLWEMIEEGNFPEWELGLQVFSEKDAEKFDFDILDPTKLVPEEIVPVKKVGKMTLNRNPENYFAETEQVAFHLGNLVPGIDVTNDPLLQARLFSYLDTQLNRFGTTNYNELPINRSLAKVSNNQQDGFMRSTINKGRVNYFPNSLAGNAPTPVPEKEGGFVNYPEQVQGTKIRQRSESFSDHYSQATLFYQSLNATEKKHLIQAGTFELSKVATLEVRERVIENFMKVDPDLALAIAAKVGVKTVKTKSAPVKKKLSPRLSQDSFPGEGLKGRNVAVMVEEGFTYKEFKDLEGMIKPLGAKATLVSSKIGDLKASDGSVASVGKSFLSSGSVMFDAIYIPGGKKSVDALMRDEDAVLFLNEAYKHFKSIGCSEDARPLLSKTTVDLKRKGQGIFVESKLKGFVASLPLHRNWDREVSFTPA